MEIKNFSTEFAQKYAAAAKDGVITKKEIEDLKGLAKTENKDEQELLKLLTEAKDHSKISIPQNKEGTSAPDMTLDIDYDAPDYAEPKSAPAEDKPTTHAFDGGITVEDNNSTLADGAGKVSLKGAGVPQTEMDKLKFQGYKGSSDFNKALKGKDYAVKYSSDKDGGIYHLKADKLNLEGIPEPATKVKINETNGKSQKVADLQQFLKEYTKGDLNVDGYLGPQTTEALAKAYQKAIQDGDTITIGKLSGIMSDLAEKFKGSPVGDALAALNTEGKALVDKKAAVEGGLEKGKQVFELAAKGDYEGAMAVIKELPVEMRPKYGQELINIADKNAQAFIKPGGITADNIEAAKKLQTSASKIDGLLSKETKEALDKAIEAYEKSKTTPVDDKKDGNTDPVPSVDKAKADTNTTKALKDSIGEEWNNAAITEQTVAMLQVAAKDDNLKNVVDGLNDDQAGKAIKQLLEKGGNDNLVIAREILKLKPGAAKKLSGEEVIKIQGAQGELKDVKVDEANYKKALDRATGTFYDNKEVALSLMRSINSSSVSSNTLKDLSAGDIKDLVNIMREKGEARELEEFLKRLAESGADVSKLSDKDKSTVMLEKSKAKGGDMSALAKADADVIREAVKTMDTAQLAALGKELAKYPGKIDTLVNGADGEGMNNAAARILHAMIKDFTENKDTTLKGEDINKFIEGVKKDYTEDDDVFKTVKANMSPDQIKALPEKAEWISYFRSIMED